MLGNKLKKKIYYKHSGYPGGLKKNNLEKYINKNYINLIKKSIKNILPKNKISKKLNKRIKIIKNYSNKFNKNKPKILINDEMNL
ncbi:50S ribosomal subunit protein L13 [Candidatus Nasuia deltocephalinicola]|nr:50S ribosomal subunit protein L13 [Candidatus Nasuia deltocephalinicola]